MNVALVHELLTMKGGAERTLRVLADMFPQAPIYTLLYDEAKLGDWFPPSRIRPSSLQKLIQPLLQTTNYKLQTLLNHHLYLPFFPRAVEAWDFSEFDLVISSSSAFVHGIITNGKPLHISFVHSPARYLWDRTHDVLERARRGPLGLLRYRYLAHIFHTLRIWDAESSDRADTIIAASKAVQRRIELYWRRESTVIYPPLDDFWLEPRNQESGTTNYKLQTTNSSYYLVVSTLVPYKRIDLAIEACNTLKFPLKIAGEGPDRRRLEKISGPTIAFLGFKDQRELRTLYEGARATLFPGEEDFGLVPLESMACGTPVIAFAKGGALETVLPGITGEFFFEPTSASLQNVLERFNPQAFNPLKLRAEARTFSRLQFAREIERVVPLLVSRTARRYVTAHAVPPFPPPRLYPRGLGEPRPVR